MSVSARTQRPLRQTRLRLVEVEGPVEEPRLPGRAPDVQTLPLEAGVLEVGPPESARDEFWIPLEDEIVIARDADDLARGNLLQPAAERRVEPLAPGSRCRGAWSPGRGRPPRRSRLQEGISGKVPCRHARGADLHGITPPCWGAPVDFGRGWAGVAGVEDPGECDSLHPKGLRRGHAAGVSDPGHTPPTNANIERSTPPC